MEPTSTFWNGKPKIGLGAPTVVKYESCNSSDAPPRVCKEEQSLFQFCDGNLNFTTVPSEDDDFSFNKKKALLARDPMSHRIIEKRRRDRMNNCLADLSRLIPAEYLKKGRGRIEKTEIIEMAIKHMKYLQDHPGVIKTDVSDTSQPLPPVDAPPPSAPRPAQPCGGGMTEQYRLGYQECLAEAVHFMVEVEGCYAGDPLCVELVGHLQRHCDKIQAGERLIFPQTHVTEAPNFSPVNTPCFPHHISNNNNNNNINNNNNNGDKYNSNNNNNDSSFSPNSGESSSDSRHDPPAPLRVPPARETPAPSHLRDMLTRPDITSNAAEKHHSTPHDPTLYKFKNTIKQRFTAEHDVAAASKRRRVASPDGRRRDSDTCSARSSSAASPEPRRTAASRHEVPIFALHARRPYYVPLTLDADALAPFADELNGSTGDEGDGDDGRQVLLHPVTISVDFLQACRGGGRRNGGGGANGFGGLNGCLPGPTTWHQCEEEARGAFVKRLY